MILLLLFDKAWISSSIFDRILSFFIYLSDFEYNNVKSSGVVLFKNILFDLLELKWFVESDLVRSRKYNV